MCVSYVQHQLFSKVNQSKINIDFQDCHATQAFSRSNSKSCVSLNCRPPSNGL